MDRTHTDSGVRYDFFHCSDCGIEFAWPLKNPGADWYSRHDRYSVRNSDPIWDANWNQRRALSFLAPRTGRLLDVGCGIGNFLAYAKTKGWDCAGLDFDPDAIKAAAKRTGLSELIVSDVVSYAHDNPGQRYDLVTFFDVLEHVDNHNEFIESIRSLIAEGGYIAMSMPYRKHAQWLMPRDVPPGHLTYWDRASLRRFLADHGFEIVYMTRRSEGIWNIVMKIRFRFGTWASFGAVGVVRKKVGDIGTATTHRPLKVRLIHGLAKVKDAALFGLPAVITWIVMLPLPSRYATLYAIARKRA